MIDSMTLTLAMHDAAAGESRGRDDVVALMSEDEFRAFYERTARPLWAYLSRMTGSPQKADDLLQEAFYRFYRAGTTYESESHRRNSLFRIATNLVRDAARRAKHREAVPIDDNVRSSAAPHRQAEIRADLGRALEQLEPQQRELLWLAYAQGVSHEEIAGILGLRAVSIRTLLFRARKKLAALLNGERR